MMKQKTASIVATVKTGENFAHFDSNKKKNLSNNKNAVILNLLCSKIYTQQSLIQSNWRNDELFGIDARDWLTLNNCI